MRTAIILAIGFVALAVCLAVGWSSGGAPRLKAAAWVFIALWFVATAVNMYIGVTRAAIRSWKSCPSSCVVRRPGDRACYCARGFDAVWCFGAGAGFFPDSICSSGTPNLPSS